MKGGEFHLFALKEIHLFIPIIHEAFVRLNMHLVFPSIERHFAR